MWIFVLVGIIVLLLAGGIYWFFSHYQERFIFFPEKLSPDHIFQFSVPFEERWYETKRNRKLHGLFFPAENSRGLILYFHGNSGSLQSWGHNAPFFVERQWDILMIDYRGFGKSQGKLKHEGMLYKDAKHIYHKLVKEYDPKNIILYGRSLGSGIAAYLGGKYPHKALILETPYYNLPDLASRQFILIPAKKLMLRYHLRTDKFLRQAPGPVYLFHGTDDELIPYDSAVRLAKIGDHIELITIEKGHHNDLPLFPDYANRMTKILGQ